MESMDRGAIGRSGGRMLTVRTRREREQPRISVNKLAEYLVAASPARRRSIIAAQKRPPDYIVPRYSDAQDAIARFLASPARDQRIITRAIERLRADRSGSPWAQQRRELCVEALVSFRKYVAELQLQGLEVELGEANQQKLVVAGVSISVRPELIVRGRDSRGRSTLGAIKLHIAKNSPLSRESAAYVGATMSRFLERTSQGEARVEPKACLVLDVFGQRLFSAPRASVRRMSEIEIACQDIARLWMAA